MGVMHWWHVGTSWAASVLRFGGGTQLLPLGRRPEELLVLYDMEGCPYCRRVREAITHLDLEVMIKPCPKRGPRFREELRKRGGKAQFPYLVDTNQGVELYESRDIVAHLFRHYGAEAAPLGLTGPWFVPSSQFASMARLMRGLVYRGDQRLAPDAPLTLYGLESSPYTRLVREVLCELELPYVLRTTPVEGSPVAVTASHISKRIFGWKTDPGTGLRIPMKGSSRWKELADRTGVPLVPYLVDGNTQTAMHESEDIVAYLFATYWRG
jgi:glutaredoxin